MTPTNDEPAVNPEAQPGSHPRGHDAVVLLARWLLGGVFIYQGLAKGLHPVDFLKIVREYGVVENHVSLNLIAATLPWFEVFCGLLLALGIAVRGSALALLGLLAPFTWLVFNRAWSLAESQGVPFCAVHFDCGCGAGEVMICAKLLENAGLMLLAAFVLLSRADRWCVRHGSFDVAGKKRSTPSARDSRA